MASQTVRLYHIDQDCITSISPRISGRPASPREASGLLNRVEGFLAQGGDVRMEGNNRYLCTVAKRGESESAGADGVYLPFEGDDTLSIILNKALLLADDAKISNSTIVSQIRR